MIEATRTQDPAAGWVASALAVVIVVTVVSLIVFFIVGGVFGPLNDVGNALIGILMAVLAIQLSGRITGVLRWIGVVLAVVGAVVAAWGSWLVISGATTFLFAGFVSTIGYGLIAVLLALVCWSPIADRWPDGLRSLGRIAAVLTIIGAIAAVPGLFSAADDFNSLPPSLWGFSLAWFGVYVLLPVWSYRLGRLLTPD
jgi:small-conductance mechanosensitive channel